MTHFHKFLNQRGLTMIELVVASGIAGIIVLAGMSVMKNLQSSKSDFDIRVDGATLSKMIESSLHMAGGCAYMFGNEVGDEFQVKVGNEVLGAGSEYSSILVESLRIDKFLPTDKSNNSGIASINLRLKSLKSKKIDQKNILLQVNVEATKDYNLKITNCNQGRTQSMSVTADKLCGGAFGKHTPGLNCDQTVKYIQKVVERSLCDDLVGDPEKESFGTSGCNVAEAHSNQTCPPGQVLMGFNDQGKFICTSLPIAGQVECKEWNSFIPAADTQCPDQKVLQTRSCKDLVYRGPSETRIVRGKKEFGCKNKPYCRTPANWHGERGEICLADNPLLEVESSSDAPSKMTGGYPTYNLEGKLYFNRGIIRFYCDENAVKIVSSECTRQDGAGE